LWSWSEVFGAKQGYEQVAEKGDGHGDECDVFEHLFEPFAGAEIKNRGDEEYERCYGEDCVVHMSKIGRACLGSGQRWIRISLEQAEGEVKEAAK
jgi:hypothetical protein